PDERREVVRPNFMLMDEGAFEKYAQRMGWDYEKAAISGALLLKGAGDLAGLPDYRKGLFSIQSVGSMLAALAVRPKRGMNVLDACAAPGGKTAYIAEQLDGTGRVYAWDVHEHRVNLIRAQAERLRLYNVRPAVRDARRHYEDMDWTVDAVLVDAPCSGLGEMANKPDIKYRITGESIDALVKTQAEILDSVCGYVKPGGALVYSTCTIMPEENAGQVRAFLERHPEFEMDLDVRWLPEAFRARVQDGCLQLMGHLDQTEGFFIARMRKKQSRRA
ncbi:MAG: methyltransferase domain-containing protein, partial [Clostridia bacterium]|nr:methyltransferase domain-containing protein [Clostridia bacterium]